jgi:hypothetical protein
VKSGCLRDWRKSGRPNATADRVLALHAHSPIRRNDRRFIGREAQVREAALSTGAA